MQFLLLISDAGRPAIYYTNIRLSTLAVSGKTIGGVSPGLNDADNLNHPFRGPAITAVAASATGRWIAAADVDGATVAFDIKSNSAQLIQQKGSFATDIVFARTQNRVMVRLADGSILWRDLDAGTKAQLSGSQLGPNATLAFSPRGSALAADLDSTGISLFDFSAGTSKHMECHCLHPLLSGDGSKLLTLEGDGQAFRRVLTWSTEDLTLVDSATPPPIFKEVVLNDDGTQIAFGGFDGSVSLLRLARPSKIIPLSGRVHSPSSLQWLTANELVVTDDDGGGQVWNIARGLSRPLFRTGPIAKPRLSANGRFVVLTNNRNDIMVHDLQSGLTQTVKEKVEGNIYSLSVSDSGSFVAFSSATLDPISVVNRAIRIASSASGQPAVEPSKPDSGKDLPLFLAKHVDSGWQLEEVCRSGGLVPSAAFSDYGMFLVNCRADAQNFTAASTQFGVALLAADGALRVIRLNQQFEMKTRERSPSSVASSPDGHWVAISNETQVEIIDVEKAQSRAQWTPELPIQNATVATSRGAPQIAIANDGTTYVLDGSGSINIYSLSGSRLGTLLSVDDYLWVVVTPEGRFDTNRIEGVSTTVKWRIESDPSSLLPLEIFTRDFYEPRLLPKLLSHELLPLPSLLSLNRVQPTVKISGCTKENGSSAYLDVTVEIANVRSTVQKDAAGRYLESEAYDVRLFRDGQIVGRWPEPSGDIVDESEPIRTTPQLQAWRKAHQVKLNASGKATINFHNIHLPRRAGIEKVDFTAYAFNSDRVKSLTTLPFPYFLPPSDAKTVERRAFIIAMGVNANQSRNLNLELAVSSAERVRTLVRSRLEQEYGKVVDIPLYSDLVTDGNQFAVNTAKKVDLKTVLDLLAGRVVEPKLRDEVDPNHQLQVATPDDAVVLYIASHGYADPQGTFYLMPSDTGMNWGISESDLTKCRVLEDQTFRCNEAKDLLAHSISSLELAAWWSAVDGGEMVMILDSCHSGALPGKQFRPGPLGDPGFGQLSYDKGMQILTATQPAQTERGEWVTSGEGRTLLIDALEAVAEPDSQATFRQWLSDAEQNLPVIAKRLYPALSEEDVLPVLMDFAASGSAFKTASQ